MPDTQWRLGNYEIMEEIGRGGMGIIYRARQRHSRRIVALKRILSYHADSHETLTRFRREAEAAASLDHPNILPIYEVGESEGVPFFSMKFATGGSLQQAGAALRQEPRQCLRIVAKVARAVQYAHRQGILHRDLKPGNILLDSLGEPLVSDFGLAKWLDASSDLTRTLTIFGTPGYIAPEQAQGRAAHLKPAADVYSLGAILFNLLAGRPPFLGENALAVIHQAAETRRAEATFVSPNRRSRFGNHLRPLSGARTRGALSIRRRPGRRLGTLAGRPAHRGPAGLAAGASCGAGPTAIRCSQWTTGALAALLMLSGGLFTWHWQAQARANAEMAKLREGIMQFAQLEAQVCQPGERQMQNVVYAELASQLGVDAQLLQGKLPPFAAYLRRSPTASLYERANAAYVAKALQRS